MRLCYDSTNPFDIPTSAGMVAGYADGIYVWPDAGWARFPNAVHVRIAVSPLTNDGQVLDVETFDATPAQAPHWVLMRRAAGVDPTVYVNRSNIAAVKNAFQVEGIPEPHYWLSTLDNSQPWAPGIVAIQYAGSNLAGGHYDLSVVADFWPGVDRPGSTAGSEIIVEEPMTLSDMRSRVRTFYNAFLGRKPGTMAELDQWINGPVAVMAPDGSNLDEIAAKIEDSAEGVAYRNRLAEVLAAGPPKTGPAGPPGPPGPPGPAVTHVSGTFTGTAA